MRMMSCTLSILALVALAACSSGRRAPREAVAGPTSIAYTAGSTGNWTTPQAGGSTQPVYQPAAPRYAPVAPAAPRYATAPYPTPTYPTPTYPTPTYPTPTGYPMPASPGGASSNVAPFPQAPAAPVYESVPTLTPTPGRSVTPGDWSAPSAPLPPVGSPGR